VKISGYVPCFNDAATVLQAVKSLQAQQPPLHEIYLVDDGSTDDSAACAKETGARVISMAKNCGRGAARAKAFEEAAGELVLSCDATARLDDRFLQQALPHFEDPKVAAVYGQLIDPSPKGASGRWRNRHLFKSNDPKQVRHHAPLATWGVLMRKSAVLEVGNFSARCRHSEDAELGARLAAKGWDIIFDPSAQLTPMTHNCVGGVLERYWRWHIGPEEKFGFRRYIKQFAYSVSAMARKDLRERDPLGALISLCTPHYFVWRKFVGE
jgi:poly-beta-1,6-N-acetyl-D-glucosamine synthase